MIGRGARAGAWLLALVGIGVALRAAAGGDLAGPPLASGDELLSWIDARSPAAAAVALVRLVAELSVWYVLGLSVLHLLSRALRRSGGHRLADALAAPGVRRLVQAGLGVGLVAASSVSGSAVPGSAGDTPTGTAQMTPVIDQPASGTRAVEPGTGTATMRPGTAAAPAGGVAQLAPAPTTWTVTTGESFWTIAHDLLADTWGRAARDHEVVPFWQALIEVNRSRLVDPDDADLIFPGQVFEVPPVPSPVP